MSTIRPGLHAAGAHLHQKIGAASQDARGTSGRGKGADRFVERAGRQISDIGHGRSAVSLIAPVMSAHRFGPCARPQPTRAGTIGIGLQDRFKRRAPMRRKQKTQAGRRSTALGTKWRMAGRLFAKPPAQLHTWSHGMFLWHLRKIDNGGRRSGCRNPAACEATT